MRLLRLAAALAAALASACGSDGGSPAPGVPAFQLRTPAGVALVQSPAPGEGPVRGLVEVVRRANGVDQPVSGALVKLGDAVIPESATAGLYDLAGATVALTPGGVGRLTAAEGMDYASVTFQCPPEVVLDRPADEASTAPGSAVELGWTGRIAYNSGTFAPAARLRPWDPASGGLGAPYASANVKPGTTQTSATLTVPADGKPGYVAELVVPGLFADQSSSGGKAICILERRARLRVR